MVDINSIIESPIFNLTQAMANGLRPPPPVNVAEWAEEWRRVCVSDSFGRKWDNKLVPYLVPLMDAMSDFSPVRELYVVGAVQIGKTQIGINMLYAYLSQRPNIVILMYPSFRPTAQDFMKLRFIPELEAMRHVPGFRLRSDDGHGAVKGDGEHNAHFVSGGSLKIVSATSPASTTAVPSPTIIIDEVDSNITGELQEGSPHELARARARNYPNSKVLIVSSPKKPTGKSVITSLYDGAELQLEYRAPCPACRTMQTLDFERLVFNRDADVKAEIGDVYIRCVNKKCDYQIVEGDKAAMLAAGNWYDQKSRKFDPRNPHGDTVGARITSMLSHSSQYPWQTIAEDFVRAKNDMMAIRVFHNTVLAETVSDVDGVLDYDVLSARALASGYRMRFVPEGALILLAGCDVQGDHVRADVWGFGENERMWLIDSLRFDGKPSAAETWAGVQHGLLRARWQTVYGQDMRISGAGIDIGGQAENQAWAHYVIKFCSEFCITRNFWPVRGATYIPSIENGVIFPRNFKEKLPTGQLTGRMWTVYLVNTIMAKDYLFNLANMRTADDLPLINFPKDLERERPSWMREFTSEVAIVNQRSKRRGYEKRTLSAKNEALDCAVYAVAMARHPALGVAQMNKAQWQKVREYYSMSDEEKAARKKEREAAAALSRQLREQQQPARLGAVG